jgi:L-ascorbate metabolism protein UlaG (beta-lactamase superfamily)
MRLTHLGHSCLLVESAQVRVLLDPGGFSAGFEHLVGLDAVVITHQHPDHVDIGRLPGVLAANPDAVLLVEPETADQLGSRTDLPVPVTRFSTGDELTLGGARLTAVGGVHAVIHPEVPLVGNVGLLIRADGEPTLFHPGDSYDTAPPGVDVLALPLNAPWAKVSETVQFTRAVAPGRFLPIHDGLLTPSGRSTYLSRVSELAPPGAKLLEVSDEAVTV